MKFIQNKEVRKNGGPYKIYTDGCMLNGTKVGGNFSLSIKIAQNIRSTNHCSIFQTQFVSLIQTAVKIIENVNITGRNITILSEG